MFDFIKRFATKKLIAAVIAALLLGVGIVMPPEAVDAIATVITDLIGSGEPIPPDPEIIVQP